MKLTAYDGNQWRIDRLIKARRIACAILGMDEPQMAMIVDEIEDHKGALVVRWKSKQTPWQELAFQAAWNECGEYAVHHVLGLGDWA